MGSASVLAASGALAQTAGTVPPPTRYVLDDNGVNLATGEQFVPVTELSIGAGEAGLALTALRGAAGDGSNFVQFVYGNGIYWSATVPSGGGGSRAYRFVLAGGAYTSATGEQATLALTGGGYVLTLGDGTRYTYAGPVGATADGAQRKARLTELLDSDGTRTTLTYNSIDYCAVNNQDNCSVANSRTKIRLQSVANSYGYQLQYRYVANQAVTSQQGANWDKLNTITAFNRAVDQCVPDASTCTYSQTWPTASYTSGFTVETVTVGGKTTRYDRGGGGSTPITYSITRPGSTAADVTVTLDTAGRTSAVTVDGRTTNYAWSLAGTLLTATITNPDASTRVVVSDTTVGLPVSVRDELNRTTTYEYDAQGRLTRAVAPEGDATRYIYNDGTQRGNLVETRRVSRTPGTPADIVTTAGYPTTCGDPRTCNQPAWTRDAGGHQTDYAYDPTHGGVLTVTAPAVAVNGTSVRPQVRYGYAALQAYYKDAAGAVTASGATAYRLTSVSACRTTTTCTDAADETRTAVGYGPQSAGTANNLLPVTVTSGSGAAFAAGDTAALVTVTSGYDAVGNLTSVDGPLAGSADTTRYRYDALRQLVGTVAADPDGAGPLPRPAVRITRNDLSQPVTVEEGTVAGTSDADWTNFAAWRRQETVYDRLLPVQQKLAAGSTVYALTQTSYDARGRAECTATRMNPAAFGSLPASACGLGTAGSEGPDRIVRTTYDAAGQVVNTTSALGTADQSDDATATYTPNGRVAHVTDAEGNRTTYGYDGHDRLLTIRYPVTTKGADTSSTGDYEQLAYDAAGNVTGRRLRDGRVLGYAHDALGRVTVKTVPDGAGLPASATRDVYYGYDLTGRLLSARFDSATGEGVSAAYDALGRMTGTTTTMGGTARTLTYAYDQAGNRTRVDHPDGNFAFYSYDILGRTTLAWRNGTHGVASYGYDAPGRLSGIGAGYSTFLSYDPVGRLSQLRHHPAAAGASVQWDLARNAAGQVTSSARTNDAYAWTGAVNVDRAYASNGLNQYTSAGAASFTYSLNGNLQTDGTNYFTYDVENRLVAFTNGSTLGYDPLGRLDTVTRNGATTRFLYDGDRLVAEYDGAGSLLRRYIHGPGTDDPVAWYEGAGVSDASQRLLRTDPLGSVTTVANGDTSAILAVNSYDEYGIPSAGNQGRFGYTGQVWLPELGLWYYKARMYSPTLGRFLHSAPTGCADGMNWYAYVGGDPVNGTDPAGEEKKSEVPKVVPQGSEVVVQGCEGPKRILCIIKAQQVQLLRAAFARLQRITGSFSNEKGGESSSNKKECPVKGTNTAHGTSVGIDPKPYNGSGPLNTQRAGGYYDAMKLFMQLTKSRDFGSYSLFPPQGLLTNAKVGTVARGNFSNIGLRISVRDGTFRIDIPANTLDLSIPEDVHFSGEVSSDCQ